RRASHENQVDDNVFPHWYHGEPDLCWGRSCRIFHHRLPQLSLLELRGRRLRRSLRHNGGSYRNPRRRLDHIHRWSGHFRWGRVLCTYRRSGHGARPAKVLELGAEELLGTSLAEKSPRLRAIYVVARGRPLVMSTNVYHGFANSLLFFPNWLEVFLIQLKVGRNSHSVNQLREKQFLNLQRMCTIHILGRKNDNWSAG